MALLDPYDPYINVRGTPIDQADLAGLPALVSALVTALLLAIFGGSNWMFIVLAGHFGMSWLCWCWFMDEESYVSTSKGAIICFIVMPIVGALALPQLVRAFWPRRPVTTDREE